eukprot:CAMPEP_0181249472 /NCGR_PEP_ID=MMETSP1096-20121128/45778_1 /TAXON_ID=156174 ORGANISM="Chrysochromulina ericina, Strain CCMP281" /NCGR_SAMPLE_ID=MMETSP1096 /ASSEMBLY_ACC=CAM_ASM_000453 /LENGTH=134 /DNA_ID=CAMNT_0023346823 /DNA_START=248 /DNA_END=648 /DNA_ORIENTATION=+
MASEERREWHGLRIYHGICVPGPSGALDTVMHRIRAVLELLNRSGHARVHAAPRGGRGASPPLQPLPPPLTPPPAAAAAPQQQQQMVSPAGMDAPNHAKSGNLTDLIDLECGPASNHHESPAWLKPLGEVPSRR